MVSPRWRTTTAAELLHPSTGNATTIPSPSVGHPPKCATSVSRSKGPRGTISKLDWPTWSIDLCLAGNGLDVESVPEHQGNRYPENQGKQHGHLDALLAPGELGAIGSELRRNQQQAPDAGNQRNDEKRFNHERPFLDGDPNGMEQLRNDEQNEPVVQKVRYNLDGLEG